MVAGSICCTYDTRGVIPGGGAGGATAPPTFGQQHFTIWGVFHTPLTERYHQKWCQWVVLCQSDMVMSDKTAIVQLKSSRSMISLIK